MTVKQDANNLKSILHDRDHLRSALDSADVAPLLMVLIHLGGSHEWLDRIAPYIKGPWSFHDETPKEIKAELCDALIEVLADYAESGRDFPTEPPAELLPKMLNTCTGSEVPAEYYPLVVEEMDLANDDPKTVSWRQKPDSDILNKFKVVVIGAGFSGIGMGIKLQDAGIPFTIIEKNPEVGGTWYENTYPGCGVDTANHFYSYSFNNNPEWNHFFAHQEEILDYAQATANKYSIYKNIRFSEEVTQAVWDESRALWHIETVDKQGQRHSMDANILVSAVGQLNRPRIPEIKGLENFKGPHFHSARWDHTVSVAGKRVGLIGTGASGMQIAPAIAPLVEKLVIFQRSAHWAMHNPLYFEKCSDGKKWLLHHIPFYAKWFRFQLFWSSSDGFHSMLQKDPEWPDKKRSINAQNAAVRKQLEEHIAKEVGGDPELIRKATPDYPPYGKRMLRDNHWYRMLTRPNVNLVDQRIDHVAEHSVVTEDGSEHEVDILVLATGFQANRMLTPMRIQGRDEVTIRDTWGENDPRAYLGITVPKFPNFFVMYGPNTNLGHGGSAIFHSECQVRYTMLAIREMLETGKAVIEVKAGPFWDYQHKVDEAHNAMVWSHPGVSSWYKNSEGRVTNNSPWRLVDYRNLTAEFNPEDYEFRCNRDSATWTMSLQAEY